MDADESLLRDDAREIAEAETLNGEPQWADAISAELAKPYPDRHALKSLCSGHVLPNEVRRALWQHLLGVQRKPDILGSWEIAGELKTAALLRAECDAQAAKVHGAEEDRTDMVDAMVLVLRFYCSVRSVEYRPGWAEVLLPFMCVGLGPGEAYNCFYAMLDKYIPYSSAHANKLPYRVFRLLLQYHDPQLAHFLDTMRVDPHLYVYNWFRSLFVHSVPADVSMALWDCYLLESDPYIIFHMTLVLLINARDAILAAQSAEELEALLPTQPEPLTAADAEDFVACALHYAFNTPYSVRQRDLQSHLFATNSAQEGKLPAAVASVMDDLCLSVSAAEVCQQSQLTRQITKRLRYLVIDTRTKEQFSNGRLPTAFHVDPQTMLEDSEAFYDTVRNLEQMAEDHLCFYGTGQDGDTHLRAIISHFLQRNFKNISYVRGGYEAIHGLLMRGGASELADHNQPMCRVCTPTVYVDDDVIHQPALERKQQRPQRFLFGLGRRVASEGTSPSLVANLSKKLSIASLKSGSSAPDTAPGQVVAGGDEKKESAEELPDANSWTGLQSIVKKSAGDFLEKGKDALIKLQTVTAPMDQTAGAPAASHRKYSGEAQNSDKKVRQRSVFGIGGSDDEDAGSSEGEGHEDDKANAKRKVVSEDLSGLQRVTRDDWPQTIGAVHEFDCNEILPEGAWMPSCIVTTNQDFIILRTPMEYYPDAFVKEKRPLRTLVKITAKKKHPNLITFSFKESDATQAQRRFMLPNGRECSKEVSQLVLKSVQGS